MKGSVATFPLGTFILTVVFSLKTWPGALETGFLVEQLNDSGCCIRNVSDVISYLPISRRHNACILEMGERSRGPLLFFCILSSSQ